MTTPEHEDTGDDLEIHSTKRRTSAPGTWVRGTVSGYRFDALVFPEHAEVPEYELADSRISKLWIKRTSDQQVVCNFDRGWDVVPTDATVQAIVDFLAAGLAEHTFGE